MLTAIRICIYISITLVYTACAKEISYEKQIAESTSSAPIQGIVGNTAPSVEGKYQGYYGIDDNLPTIYYAFEFQNNNKIIITMRDSSSTPNPNFVGVGTYQLNNNALTATYTYPNNRTYSVKAYFDSQLYYLSGSWGKGSSFDDGGTFWLKRKEL